ncbi:NAD(P)/FAD-dependent oxidoreductase [Myxosarcina sp. GI1(2024)]
MKIYDVAIVGAGLSGLTCARQLEQRGYRVIVVEKSRGVGGRVTTRRVGDRLTIDRGLPWLEVQGKETQKSIEQLLQEKIIQPWNGRICQRDRQGNIQPTETKNLYVAPAGIDAIGKYLAQNLTIERQCRIESIQPNSDNTWGLMAKNYYLQAKAVVIAIPAPQALEILKKIENCLSAELVNQLRAVKYFPCITVSAGYEERSRFNLPPWEVLNLNYDEKIAKIILNSSKQKLPTQPVFIFHSTPQFAYKYLEVTDLEPVGEQLLARAAPLLQSWLKSPQWMQVHRWRYAIPSEPLTIRSLATSSPLPLVCCGDWCGGNNLESALNSGMASAEAIASSIEPNS